MKNKKNAKFGDGPLINKQRTYGLMEDLIHGSSKLANISLNDIPHDADGHYDVLCGYMKIH